MPECWQKYKIEKNRADSKNNNNSLIFILLLVKNNGLRLIFAVLGLNSDTFLNLFAKKHIQFARNTLPVNEPGRGHLNF